MSLVIICIDYLGVGGVPVSELNQMELEFLKLCDFSLLITPAELVECGDSLLNFSMKYRAGQSYVLPPLLSDPHTEFRNDIIHKTYQESDSPSSSPLTVGGRENFISHSTSSEIHQLDDTASHTTSYHHQLPATFVDSNFTTLQTFETFQPTLVSTGTVSRLTTSFRNSFNLKHLFLLKSKSTTKIQRRYRKSVYGGKRKEWKNSCDGPVWKTCGKCNKNFCRCKFNAK